MKCVRNLIAVFVLIATSIFAGRGQAADEVTIIQRTPDASLTTRGPQIATLRQQLVSRLRATTTERKKFLNYVVAQVAGGRLDIRLVVAIERYSIRRYRDFPFPFFERAIRFEAAKRGVALPRVETFVSTANPNR